VPAAVLTGDTLFVGDVGRPDLRAALGWSAADLGSLLFDSLREKLLTLPRDPTMVAFSHWYGREFIRQIDGLEPEPWSGPVN